MVWILDEGGFHLRPEDQPPIRQECVLVYNMWTAVYESAQEDESKYSKLGKAIKAHEPAVKAATDIILLESDQGVVYTALQEVKGVIKAISGTVNFSAMDMKEIEDYYS